MLPRDMATVFKDKFVAFVDVLGFKDMVQAAENGQGRSLDELTAILTELDRTKNETFFQNHGPQTCPCSACIKKDLDFEVTAVSDCVVMSAEVSPAGVINLIHACWGAAIMLLTKGVMVRGYITRGPIVHEGNTIIGTGYQTAYEREGQVTAFKKETDEKGTPFVEVDVSVCSYIEGETDECVRDMFSRMVKSDGEVTALFPFKRLAHSFMIGGPGAKSFDRDKEKAQNDVVRRNLIKLKEAVMRYVDSDNERALRKARHYIAALDDQLKVCDGTDKFIDGLQRPLGRPWQR